jgi:acetyl esterase/lipase
MNNNKKLKLFVIIISTVVLQACRDFWFESPNSSEIKEFQVLEKGDKIEAYWDKKILEARLQGEIVSAEIQPYIGNIDHLWRNSFDGPVEVSPPYSGEYYLEVRSDKDGVVRSNTASAIVLHDYCAISGTTESLKLDLRIPDAEQYPEGNFPVAVFIHGGAWAGGHYSGMHQFLVQAAERGYIGVSVSYRLNSQTSNVQTIPPLGQWPNQVQDVKCAIRWLKEQGKINASGFKSLDLDKNKFAVIGYSSGAHLALLIGLTDTTTNKSEAAKPYIENFKDRSGFIYDESEQADESIQAVVSIAGPTELLSMWQDLTYRINVDTFQLPFWLIPDNLIDKGILPPVLSGLETMSTNNSEIKKEFDEGMNPAFYLDSESAKKPFLLIYGQRDRVVHPFHGCQFARALEEQAPGETDYVFLQYKGADHNAFHKGRSDVLSFDGFLRAIGGEGSHQEQTRKDIFSFLDSHLKGIMMNKEEYSSRMTKDECNQIVYPGG